MTQGNLDLRERFSLFWQNIDIQSLKGAQFYFHLIGWLLTFYFLFLAIQADASWKFLWLIFHLYFWFRLNKDILKYIYPPVELLLASLLIFYKLGSWYINYRWTSLSISGLDPIADILSALLILNIGLLLIINSPANRKIIISDEPERPNFKQGGIIFYILLWFLGHKLVLLEEDYFHIIFQGILFFSLLSKTTWLEKLTQRELWVYMAICAVIFLSIQDPAGYKAAQGIEADQYITWYSIPLFIHYLVKIYFLVLVVKIPVIVIYNHAGLERKLKIASVFQSTLPQLIQFVFLILTFFYFISGWQALNLRKVIYAQIDSITSPARTTVLPVKKVPLIGQENVIFLPGYEPKQIVFDLPEQGILSLIKLSLPGNNSVNDKDYFLYSKHEKMLHIIPLDTSFVHLISQELPIIAGSGLVMYPFAPREWQEMLYDNRLFQDNFNLHIYPFSFTTAQNSQSIYSQIDREDWNSEELRISSGESLFYDMRFVIGRVFIPVAGEETGNLPYFAIDIYQKLDLSSLNPNVAKIFLILAVLFLIADAVVIRRLGKFGNEITNIIVQKFDILKKGIRQISSGNLDYQLKMGGEDEFVELAGHFNEMSHKLKKTIAEAREKDKLDHELKIARQVQRSLLPEQLPEVTGYKIAASITTANDIGGDFYDIMPLDKDQFLFAIGDVSGKGSSAAFYMAQFISLLRYSPQFTKKPVEIARRLNAYFASEVKDRQIFVTSVIGVLDTKAHSIKFVRTGHTPPIMIPGDENEQIYEINSDGLGIGLTKTSDTFSKALMEKTIQLQPGDHFLLYTDGVIEAARATDSDHPEVFGEERFQEILRKARSLEAELIEHSVSDEISAFYHNQAPVDDYTLFIIQRTKEDNR